MGEFFKGWRRKFGVVTLLMSLFFVGCWMRSFASTNDHFKVWANHSIYSHNGSVSWNIRSYDGQTPEIDQFVIVRPNRPTLFLPKPQLTTTKWIWKWYGLLGKEYSIAGRSTIQYWVSYWYFISPLTLLSAYLLLFEPRKSTLKKNTKPISTEGMGFMSGYLKTWRRNGCGR